MSELINMGQPFIGSRTGELGIRRGTFKNLVATGSVRRVFRGVYVDASVSDSRSLRVAALRLVKPPGAVFYGATAAFLLGVDVFAPKDRFNQVPQCVVLHHGSRCLQTLVRCREGYLPPSDLEEMDGLVVTNPTRTTVDLLRTLWRPYALASADAMAHAGHVSPEGIMASVHAMRRYPGIVQARSLARLVDDRVESAGESWLRLRLVDAGFPIPEPQFAVYDNAGTFRARLDDAYEAVRVGMEYDGREFHSDTPDTDHDAQRRNYLTDILGWRVRAARREEIFGDDPSFELEIGTWIGIPPQLPRPW